jgi:hypothetical protein
LNFISFEDQARFEYNADKLAEALSTDIEWIRKHTEFGELARCWWEASPRPRGLCSDHRRWRKPNAGWPADPRTLHRQRMRRDLLSSRVDFEVKPLVDIREVLENNGIVAPKRFVPRPQEYVAIPLH